MFAIRSATPEDAGTIWAMLKPVFRAGETYCVPRDIDEKAALDYWSGGAHEVFVAQEGAEALGTFYLTPNQRGGGAHVANCGFITAKAAQGRGVARRMLDHALTMARARGFRAMQFNFVISTNTRAIAIWDACGFSTVGRLPGAYLHPEHGYVDALVMFRTL